MTAEYDYIQARQYGTTAFPGGSRYSRGRRTGPETGPGHYAIRQQFRGIAEIARVVVGYAGYLARRATTHFSAAPRMNEGRMFAALCAIRSAKRVMRAGERSGIWPRSFFLRRERPPRGWSREVVSG